jgi:hypothetical protein
MRGGVARGLAEGKVHRGETLTRRRPTTFNGLGGGMEWGWGFGSGRPHDRRVEAGDPARRRAAQSGQCAVTRDRGGRGVDGWARGAVLGFKPVQTK